MQTADGIHHHARIPTLPRDGHCGRPVRFVRAQARKGVRRCRCAAPSAATGNQLSDASSARAASTRLCKAACKSQCIGMVGFQHQGSVKRLHRLIPLSPQMMDAGEQNVRLSPFRTAVCCVAGVLKGFLSVAALHACQRQSHPSAELSDAGIAQRPARVRGPRVQRTPEAHLRFVVLGQGMWAHSGEMQFGLESAISTARTTA